MSAGSRVAAVTGASSGVGRAIAVALGGLGWRVALGARREEPLEESARLAIEAGGEAYPCPLDVTDAHSVDEFFAAVEKVLGPVDALVNNAGIAIPGPFWDLAPEQLEEEVRTNLLGPMLCTRRVLRSMVPRGHGDVVFVSSDTARSPRPRLLGYSATKAGVEVMARALAMELEGTGVRATTVRLGPTLTDFASGWSPEQVAELITYWPRFGIQRHFHTLSPDDVARAVIYAVTSPPGVHVDIVEVQPEAPKDDPGLG
jgi:NAD(P)-dependent dehydrogenase (short-subunit alcohol dehydrogenase family)